MKLIYLNINLQTNPYSQWIKNNTQQKRTKQHLPKKDHFPLIEKEDLTDK